MQWHVEHLAYHSHVSRDQALSFTELKTQTPTPTHQLDNRRIKKTYIFQENTTFSLGNVTYAARAPLFSRKDLQHSFRGHGGAPAGVPTPGGSSHAGGILAASATQPLASAKLN
jgi:hypothetical protein